MYKIVSNSSAAKVVKLLKTSAMQDKILEITHKELIHINLRLSVCMHWDTTFSISYNLGKLLLLLSCSDSTLVLG
jgi:hypothetical protein